MTSAAVTSTVDEQREYVIEQIHKEDDSNEPGFDDGDEEPTDEEEEECIDDISLSEDDDADEELRPSKRERPEDDRIKMTFQWSFEADAKSVHVQNILRQLGNCMHLQSELRRLEHTGNIQEKDIESGMTNDELETWAIQEDFAAMQREKKRKRNPFVLL